MFSFCQLSQKSLSLVCLNQNASKESTKVASNNHQMFVPSVKAMINLPHIRINLHRTLEVNQKPATTQSARSLDRVEHCYEQQAW